MSLFPDYLEAIAMPATADQAPCSDFDAFIRDCFVEALSEQVPDMLNGFIITTSFGSINIDAEFAEAFRNLAADVLQYQLNQIVANQTTRIEL
ncbi:MAG: hypothetical protein PHI97_30515, partial [Desulfobulbus sp.]|nr:hypothetical protein [Desulfobulbus sp.]